MSKLWGFGIHQTSRESERAVIGKTMLESQREAGIGEGKLSGDMVVAVAPVESGDCSASHIGGSFLVEFGEFGRSEQFFVEVFTFDFVFVT